MTRRLVDAGADVLLIEAGPAGIGVDEIDDPAQWVPLGRGAYDWGYDYAPTPHVNGRTIGIPRGRVLGGSSAINAMMWYRGHPQRLRRVGGRRREGLELRRLPALFPALRGLAGRRERMARRGRSAAHRTRARELHPVAQALIDGAAALGIPVIDDPNGP